MVSLKAPSSISFVRRAEKVHFAASVSSSGTLACVSSARKASWRCVGENSETGRLVKAAIRFERGIPFHTSGPKPLPLVLNKARACRDRRNFCSISGAAFDTPSAPSCTGLILTGRMRLCCGWAGSASTAGAASGLSSGTPAFQPLPEPGLFQPWHVLAGKRKGLLRGKRQGFFHYFCQVPGRYFFGDRGLGHRNIADGNIDERSDNKQDNQ